MLSKMSSDYDPISVPEFWGSMHWSLRLWTPTIVSLLLKILSFSMYYNLAIWNCGAALDSYYRRLGLDLVLKEHMIQFALLLGRLALQLVLHFPTGTFKKIELISETQISGLILVLQPLCSVLRRVQLFETMWTVACQAPLSIGFSRQEY